jgi:hypothetical protein
MATDPEYVEFQEFMAWKAAQATGAGTPGSSPLVDETLVTPPPPVTEHPAYNAVAGTGGLLEQLHLQGTEDTIRNIYSWLDTHFTAIEEGVEKDLPEVEADVKSDVTGGEAVVKDLAPAVKDASALL